MKLTEPQKRFITSIYDEDVSMTSFFECCPSEKRVAEALARKGVVKFPSVVMKQDADGYFEAALTDDGYAIAKQIYETANKNVFNGEKKENNHE